jgi:hypothetical protein
MEVRYPPSARAIRPTAISVRMIVLSEGDMENFILITGPVEAKLYLAP